MEPPGPLIQLLPPLPRRTPLPRPRSLARSPSLSSGHWELLPGTLIGPVSLWDNQSSWLSWGKGVSRDVGLSMVKLGWSQTNQDSWSHCMPHPFLSYVISPACTALSARKHSLHTGLKHLCLQEASLSQLPSPLKPENLSPLKLDSHTVLGTLLAALYRVPLCHYRS